MNVVSAMRDSALVQVLNPDTNNGTHLERLKSAQSFPTRLLSKAPASLEAFRVSSEWETNYSGTLELWKSRVGSRLAAREQDRAKKYYHAAAAAARHTKSPPKTIAFEYSIVLTLVSTGLARL